MSSAPGPVVVGQDRLDQRGGGTALDIDRWTTLARRALEHEGVHGPAEVTLVFVGADAMAELDGAHMGGTGPTDVLAFPIDADLLAPTTDPVSGPMPRLLGDVVVCPAVAAENAVAASTSLQDELALLVVHGVLHVLGHDHADAAEAQDMRSRETELLDTYHRSAQQ